MFSGSLQTLILNFKQNCLSFVIEKTMRGSVANGFSFEINEWDNGFNFDYAWFIGWHIPWLSPHPISVLLGAEPMSINIDDFFAKLVLPPSQIISHFKNFEESNHLKV